MKFAAAFVLAVSAVRALPAITRTGRYLYNPDGTRFLIKGIAYQEAGVLADNDEANAANGGFPEPSTYVDPLAQADACARDLPYLQQLGVNVVRVYSVNASLNHDVCMKTFSDAGIYTMIDLGLPLNGSINRATPAWQTNLLDLYTTTIQAFNKYDNVLAYGVGNEVVTLPANTNAAPFIKAAARDTKAFLKSISSTALVSYTSTDMPVATRNALATYLSCGSDDTSIDLYGLNNYEWCGQQTYLSSGWQGTTADYANLTIPAYFSEYGCNKVSPRLWSEVPVLFSQPVTDTWSGGIAFSYFPTNDDYGLITLSGDNNSTVNLTADYTNLAAVLANVTLAQTPAQKSVSNAAPPACPPKTADFNASTTLPPTPNKVICDCLEKSAFACTRTERAANSPVIIGSLIDYGCSLLGQISGQSCDAIGASGSTGTYGAVSYCSPDVKASYVFSAYYVSTRFNDQSCDFGGNATINSNVPKNAEDASNAASSCLAQEPASGVFTPTTMASNAVAGGGQSTATKTQSGANGPTGSSTPASGAMGRWSSLSLGPFVAAVAAVVGGAVALV